MTMMNDGCSASTFLRAMLQCEKLLILVVHLLCWPHISNCGDSLENTQQLKEPFKWFSQKKHILNFFFLNRENISVTLRNSINRVHIQTCQVIKYYFGLLSSLTPRLFHKVLPSVKQTHNWDNMRVFDQHLGNTLNNLSTG